MLKVHFTTESGKQIEQELLSVMEELQETSLRLVLISNKIGLSGLKDTEGRLKGYADIINSTSGSISELFEFYK